MSIKTSFSIKDLENLSGIKAHTIRIWEKRYRLLEPNRSDSNIRTYNLDSLQKILNISQLNQAGLKVSKIANYSEEEIYNQVRNMLIEGKDQGHAFNLLKLSMLTFDHHLFEKTYNELSELLTFKEIFMQVFLPLLEHIGLLWMAKTITPVHEHFISNLIKQKILFQTEQVQYKNLNQETTYVLFLPMNEMHEIGIMYIHYELLLGGYHSIYLGPSVPTENLKEAQELFGNIVYISGFTVAPQIEMVDKYLSEFSTNVLSGRKEQLHIYGRKTKNLDLENLAEGVVVHQSLDHLLQNLEL